MVWRHRIWRAWNRLARAYWALRGGRHVTAMGETLDLNPETVFPSHRRLRLPKGDWRSEIVRYADFVQMHSCCRYCSELAHPPVIVDVGAHHGAYAVVLGRLAASHPCGEGRVIAIEPNPQSVAILADNVRRNGLEGVVAVEPVAITEQPSEMRLALEGSQSHLVADCRGASTAAVRGEPLAHVLERNCVGRVDLLIIDVEGAELPVLRSFPWRSVVLGRVFCELHPYAWGTFGYRAEDFHAFLEEHGFRCLDMYFHEYKDFATSGYIGPCCLLFRGCSPSGERG